MERFLAKWLSKTHKKTAGVAGGFWEIRTFFRDVSELSTADGA
jgi:hypothetical protein